MRNRRPSPDHAEAVARRLALLEAELDATRRSATSTGVGAVPSGPEVGGPVGEPVTRTGLRPAHGETVAGGERVMGGEALAPVAVAWVDLGAGPETPPVDGPPSASPGDVPRPSSPGPVRAPGRHVRRRRSGRLLTGLSGAVTDRVRLTPAHVTVVATVVAAALAVTCWWLLSARVEPSLSPVASPVRTLSPGTGAASPASPSGAASASAGAPGRPGAAAPGPGGGGGSAAELVVHVAGKVRRPGIVVLPAGSRVVDALEAAGGARRGVDLSPLNLARPLTDGEQILVGVDAPPGGVAGGPAGGASPGAGGALVNINLASLDELDTLPGVGPVTAQAIVDWRTRHGGFTAVDDLLEVDGIGDATLQKLAPLVTL